MSDPSGGLRGGLARYRSVLAIPHLRWLMAAATVGRLPVAMLALSLVLLVEAATGSYATAGAVTAAQALAAAAAAPVLGRLIDRLGQTRVLVTCAIAFPACVGALVAVAELQPTTPALLAVAVPFGASSPPLFAAWRALLSSLAREPRIADAAFALEAVMQELLFVSGPLLVAGLVAFGSPQLALGAAALLTLAGTLAFAAAPPSRAWRSGRTGASALGVLTVPGVRTLLAMSVGLGTAFGTLEVATPAFAERHGSPQTAGVLLATLALGSMAGGLWYGARRFTRDTAALLTIFTALLALALAPLGLADSIGMMLPLMLLAGLFVAPTAAASYALVARLAPASSVTEAYTWETTAVVTGIALGGALGGLLVDSAGASTALGLAAVSAGGAAALTWARIGTLRM